MDLNRIKDTITAILTPEDVNLLWAALKNLEIKGQSDKISLRVNEELIQELLEKLAKVSARTSTPLTPLVCQMRRKVAQAIVRNADDEFRRDTLKRWINGYSDYRKRFRSKKNKQVEEAIRNDGMKVSATSAASLEWEIRRTYKSTLLQESFENFILIELWENFEVHKI